MKKFFKWFGIVIGGLFGLLVVLLAVFYFEGNARLAHTYEIPAENIAIPTDAPSIARGKHFVQAICTGCHTPDLSGQIMMDAPFAKIYSANLTPGKGGAGSDFFDADFIRALRHGVDNQGRALMVMPAQEFWNFSDSDLADIVAYLKTLPPVDQENPDPQVNVLGKILIGTGIIPSNIMPATVIAHDQRPPAVLAVMALNYRVAGARNPVPSTRPISHRAENSQPGAKRISSTPFALAWLPADTPSIRMKCRGRISTRIIPTKN